MVARWLARVLEERETPLPRISTAHELLVGHLDAHIQEVQAGNKPTEIAAIHLHGLGRQAAIIRHIN